MIRFIITLATSLSLAGLLAGCGKDSQASIPAAQPAVQPPSESAAAPAPARLHLVIEAESMSGLTAPMALAEESDTAGGQCVRIPAGLKGATPTGRIETSFNMPAEGEVKVWYRVHWNGTCANSLTMSVAGMPEYIVGEDGTYGAWHWVHTPVIPLPQGEHTLVIGQREEDVAIDQILITQDLEYFPMGIEE